MRAKPWAWWANQGPGKSTLARAILRLVHASQGSVVWRGRDLLSCDGATLRRLRRDLQIVFQDPLASLNPRMTVGETIAEPLRIFEPRLDARERRARVGGMLERVGLTADMMGRYPHEFSGGQCQRIGIARAMILNPKLLICDEPVSSLDVSIQGQIVNLLLDLQREAGTAMLFISHNLAVVRHLSHRILVMYSGRLVEICGARCALRHAHPSLHPNPVGGGALAHTAGTVAIARGAAGIHADDRGLCVSRSLCLRAGGLCHDGAVLRASGTRALGCLSPHR